MLARRIYGITVASVRKPSVDQQAKDNGMTLVVQWSICVRIDESCAQRGLASAGRGQ